MSNDPFIQPKDHETAVQAIDHIDRGYVDFEKQLSKLGANIIRETSPQHS